MMRRKLNNSLSIPDALGQDLDEYKNKLVTAADPHISTAAQPFLNKQIRLSYTTLNPAYSLVLKERIWGQALNPIAVDQISAEQAADKAISRIKEIFANWK